MNFWTRDIEGYANVEDVKNTFSAVTFELLMQSTTFFVFIKNSYFLLYITFLALFGQ